MLAGVIALTVAVGGCGGDAEEPVETAPETGSAAEEPEPVGTDERPQAADRIEIVDFKFAPPAVTVAADTKVSWTNQDQAAHTATAEDGSFDTGTLKEGAERTIAFDEPGSYEYICEFHPFMHGTVEVE